MPFITMWQNKSSNGWKIGIYIYIFLIKPPDFGDCTVIRNVCEYVTTVNTENNLYSAYIYKIYFGEFG